MDDARALLDSLMGGDRDLKADERRIRSFTDDDYCRNFLLGLCPHDLFKNTKIDLGPCDRQHDDVVKESFDSDKDNMLYKRKWRRGLRSTLKGLMDNVDRRIGLNQSRLAREKTSDEAQKGQVTALKDDVSAKLKQAEQAASDGHFEESRRLMGDSEEIKKRIEDAEAKSVEFTRQSCEICGLIIDAQEAEDMLTARGWHSNGKQHVGYQMIRSKMVEIEREQAQDKKNGVRTPSPSPVKVRKPEVRRRKSPSPSKGQKKEDKEERRRRASRSKSRTRKDRGDDRKRKNSRSRSREKGQEKRPKSSQHRSPSKDRKRDGKRRAASSSKKRSRSRKRRSRSKGAGDRSRKEGRSQDRSRKRRSRSEEKGRKSRQKSRSGSRPSEDIGSTREGTDFGKPLNLTTKDQSEPPLPPPPPPPTMATSEAVAAVPQPPPTEPEFEMPKAPVRFVMGFRRSAG